MKLEAQSLTVGYGKKSIGKNLHLSLSQGQILCLLGPNGCGKTTLLKTLLGLLPVLSGELKLAGQAIQAMSRQEIARHVSFVPQAHTPTFPFKVLEIVLMGRTSHMSRFASPGKQDRRAAREALETLNLSHLANEDYSQLSGGQRQLVLIARALAQQSAFIIMDEPTASLDFGNQVQVLTEISRLAATNASGKRGFLLSTHDPDQAFQLNASVLIMNQGTIAAAGRPETALTSHTLTEVYGVPVQVEQTISGQRVCTPPFTAYSSSTATMTSDALITA